MDDTTLQRTAEGMSTAGAASELGDPRERISGVLAPLARSGGGLRPVAKRIFKGYFVLSDAAAHARESLTDVYAEAKHEHYSPARPTATVPRTPISAAGASEGVPAAEPANEGPSLAGSAGRLSRRGIRLLGSVLSRVG